MTKGAVDPEKVPNRSLTLIYSLAALAATAVLYAVCLPVTVQSGDSGEMVSNAFSGAVLHPPGFPAYYWLLRLFTHTVPHESVFARGAICVAAFSLLAQFTLQRLGKHAFSALLAALLLATNEFFWRYSLLPDVFMANLLWCGLFLSAYLRGGDMHWATLWLVLALSTHTSSVFLLPLFAHALLPLENRRRLQLCGALAAGTGAFYLSLMLIRSESLYSWKNLHTLGDLIVHGMRKEFGVFQLVGTERSFHLPAHLWAILVRNGITLAAVAGAALLLKVRLSRRAKFALFIAAAYVLLFFSLANASPTHFAGEIVSRFYLLPLLILLSVFCFAAGAVKAASGFRKYAAYVLLLVCALLQARLYFADNDFSKKQVLQEFALNLLKQAELAGEGRDCRVLTVKSDNVFLSLNYVQSVLAASPGVTVVADGLIPLDWFRARLVARGLRFAKPEPKDLTEDFLLPNSGHCSLVSEFYANFPKMKVTLLSVGRLLSVGSGMATRDTPLEIRSRPGFTLHYDPEKRFFARYADIHLARAAEAFRSEAWTEAELQLKKAVNAVPYCNYAWKQLCLLEQRTGKPGEACERAADESEAVYCDPTRP